MIEDKIDASFQPDQASRYRQRAEQGRTLHKWDRFVTCLCAPKAYLEPIGKGEAWGAILAYEEIDANLAMRDEAFAQFVSGALRQAVDKQRTGGFVASPQATAFWAQYRRLQHDEFPDLRMTGLGEVVGESEPWPRFAAGALPARVKLEHKPRKGRVDLTFQDVKFEDLRSRLDGRLPTNFEVCRTTPSSAVRAIVPAINASEPFEPQIEAARTAFRAAQSLLQTWPQIREAVGLQPCAPILD